MKAKFNTIIGIFMAVSVAMACSAPRTANAQTPDDVYDKPGDQDYYNDDDVENQQDVDFHTFFDALNPYGTWEDDPEYGQVWVNNDADFTPYYSNGNWAYSDAGWAWVSGYDWGWAPFHYGRWAFRNHWMWIPGYEWAPAWVSWRTGGDYYGWAPLSPGITIGIGASFGGYIAPERWNFCQRAYITNNNFRNYCTDRRSNVTIIRNTTIINTTNVYRNTRFVAGPDRREVERFTHNRINVMRIRNAGRPGATRVGRNSIRIYRPNVGQGNNHRNEFRDNRNNTGNGFQRPQGQNQRPMQQPNNNNNDRRRFQQQQPQQQPNNQRPMPNRQRENNNFPNRQNQQPATPQQRQPVYNPRQQNAANNRDNNNRADRRMAMNERRQQQFQQPQQRMPQVQDRQQAPQARPQFQQPRERPQQQVNHQQQVQTRQQVQLPRNNGGQERGNGGGGRDRSARRG